MLAHKINHRKYKSTSPTKKFNCFWCHASQRVCVLLYILLVLAFFYSFTQANWCLLLWAWTIIRPTLSISINLRLIHNMWIESVAAPVLYWRKIRTAEEIYTLYVILYFFAEKNGKFFFSFCLGVRACVCKLLFASMFCLWFIDTSQHVNLHIGNETGRADVIDRKLILIFHLYVTALKWWGKYRYFIRILIFIYIYISLYYFRESIKHFWRREWSHS